MPSTDAGKHILPAINTLDYKLLKTASSEIPAGRGLRIYPNVRLGFIIGASYKLHIREAWFVDIRESGMSVLLLELEDYKIMIIYVNEESMYNWCLSLISYHNAQTHLHSVRFHSFTTGQNNMTRVHHTV